MNNINVETWNSVYSEGRSLLQYPDEMVVSFLSKHKGEFSRGIDIACGAGRHTILMAQMGLQSYGVDSSSSSIAYAKERSSKLGLNVEFQNMLVQDMKFEDGFFDIAIVWGLVHYLALDDQMNVLTEVHRILKPGGKLLCTLRSTEDTRAKEGIEQEPNRFLVDYFDSGSSVPKKTLMYFWDEEGVKQKLKQFVSIELGHRIVEPIGKIGNKSAHWIISAEK